MAPRIVDVNDCGCSVPRTEGVVAKLVSRIEVMCELVSRRDYCA